MLGAHKIFEIYFNMGVQVPHFVHLEVIVPHVTVELGGEFLSHIRKYGCLMIWDQVFSACWLGPIYFALDCDLAWITSAMLFV